MADTVSAEQRSRNMSRIRSKNTKPELRVRQLLHRAGYRFRLHGAARGGALPGKPDLVFAGRRKVIFVNGCFWHTHSCPDGSPRRGCAAGTADSRLGSAGGVGMRTAQYQCPGK